MVIYLGAAFFKLLWKCEKKLSLTNNRRGLSGELLSNSVRKKVLLETLLKQNTKSTKIEEIKDYEVKRGEIICVE